MFDFLTEPPKSQKISFRQKASKRLSILLLSSMFIFGPIAGFSQQAYAATLGSQTLVTQQADGQVVSSSMAVDYKNSNEGVIYDTSAYKLDKGVKFTLDGKPVTLNNADGTQAYAIIVEGRTFLPIRAVADLLGGEAYWDTFNSMVVVVSSDGSTIETYNGSDGIIVNGKGVQTILNGNRTFIKDGRSYMPLRDIVQAVGFNVDWESSSRTVKITSPGFTAPSTLSSDEAIERLSENSTYEVIDGRGVGENHQMPVYDADGYNQNGYDRNGYDRNGVHRSVNASKNGTTEHDKAIWDSLVNGNK